MAIPGMIKWGATLGREPQTFLGARWVEWILTRVPENKKRDWALRLLSLSPHYFLDADAPENRALGRTDYLEKAFRIYSDSRVKIYDQILKGRLTSDNEVLDFGCGPGFLAKTVASHVRKIYACDISTGALACARVLNSAPNLEYVSADASGLVVIPDASLDAIFSFAVIQHVSDDIYEIVLENCRRKLKPGGRLILHIQLMGGGWKTEEDWKRDASLKGKIKFKYGLHCFARPESRHKELVKQAGFENVNIENVADLVEEHFDDVCSQHLLTATLPA